MNPATGLVSVPAGTPAGSYTIVYTLCEKLNPLNCQNATITVLVGSAPIVANPDIIAGINGATGSAAAGNVLTNDTINGLPATSGATGNTTITINASAVPLATAPIGNINVPALDPATGIVSVPAGTPAGAYSIGYKLCEKLNPLNCQDITVSITVVVSPILTISDSYTGINGITGAANVGNAISNDTINNASATLGVTGNAILSVATPATPLIIGSPIPVVDPSTGIVSVPANTPAGVSIELSTKYDHH
jgi:hypothetical protein